MKIKLEAEAQISRHAVRAVKAQLGGRVQTIAAAAEM
jgi:type IV secretory pathway VirD2 relaxase